VTALWATFALVVVAELGDKSMLMAMILAPRYGAVQVMVALSIEASLIMALAVLAGGAVDLLLTEQQVAIFSGLLFIGFGIWAMHDDDEEEEEITAGGRSGLLVMFALAATLFASELGDKTQVAALSLSSTNPSDRVGVWFGATTGMIVVDGLAVIIGGSFLTRVPRRLMARAAGLLFIAFGVAAFVFALV